MRIPLFKRLIITFCNIFFPPLAVALLTGWTSSDTMLNSCLFLLAIIPSHIHGFYISLVYFSRKRRVRNGKWPGKPYKSGIWSEKVLTGGAGWEEAERLKRKKKGGYLVEGGVEDAAGWEGDGRRVERIRSGRSGDRSSGQRASGGRRSRRTMQSGYGGEEGLEYGGGGGGGGDGVYQYGSSMQTQMRESRPAAQRVTSGGVEIVEDE